MISTRTHLSEGESRGDGGGPVKDEMDVEGKGNGEDGDLTHPIGSTIPGEVGEGVRGEGSTVETVHV